MKTAGIIIFIVGLLMTLYTGFTYVTKEKVVDLGEIEIRTESGTFHSRANNLLKTSSLFHNPLTKKKG